MYPIDESHKTINLFLRRTIIKERIISPKHNFSFLSSVLCLITDNYIVQKSCSWKKNFRKFSFVKKKHFNFFYPSSVPHWYFIPKFSKKILFWKLFSVQKKVLKLVFLSYLQVSVHPLATMSYKNFFSWKEFFIWICFCNILFK